MPHRLPALRASVIVKVLERAGFVVKRQTGGHVILTRLGLRRPVVVPVHRRELPRATVRDIITQAELTVEEFLKHL